MRVVRGILKFVLSFGVYGYATVRIASSVTDIPRVTAVRVLPAMGWRRSILFDELL